MGTLLSPQVIVREIDLSLSAANVSAIVPAFIGTAKKGPLNEATFITNAQQFVDTFGEPFPESTLGYAVVGYLEEGNSCWVLRVGVECEDGQVDDLSDICIDTSGANVSGWGRIPLYQGIDYGKIRLRNATTDDPMAFHDSDISDEDYNDVDVSSTDGPTAASIAVSGSYTGAIDDSFIVLITGDPDPTYGSLIDGATYDIIRNSDNVVVSSGTLSDAGSDVSTSFLIGTGDEASGLSAVITVTGSSSIETDDTFTFVVRPDNLDFEIEVESVSGGVLSFTDGSTYTTNEDFADAFNAVASGADYLAVAVSDTELYLRTSTAGERIQVVGTEAWALEAGISLYALDIPRSYQMSGEDGPFLISSANNRVTIRLQSTSATTELDVTVGVGSAITPAILATALDLGGTSAGEAYYEAFTMTVAEDDDRVVVVTTVGHQFDTLAFVADYSHVPTLRLAEEMQLTYPYFRNYRGFFDSRVSLPDSGVITAESPLSCETDASGDECALDSAYFENVVGWLVASSAGTWLDDYSVTLEFFTDGSAGSGAGQTYTLRIYDDQDVEVERIDNVSFDSREARYIGNLLNPGATLAGVNGNAYVNWEERPSYLENDPDDTSTFEVRNPARFNGLEFSGMANGIPASATYSSELDRAVIGSPALGTGLFAFSNPEGPTSGVSLLATPGFSSGSVIAQGLQICEGRGDMLYIIDPPFGLRPQQVVDWHNGMLYSDLTAAINSSYGALYWSWIEIADQFNGGTIFIPPSGHVAAVYARTERVAEQWFPPAGLQRGHLTTALDVEFSPTQGERDLLYGFNNAVNSIVKFPQDGIVVFGQRTLQRADTALDRVNVRMLLIFLKKNLVPVLRNFLFELNDKILWAQVRAVLEPFMGDVMARRGVTAFKVVCDSTNNTPVRIDRNELWVSIFLKPARAVEFIVLNLVLLRSDASFSSEAVLAAGGVVVSQGSQF